MRNSRIRISGILLALCILLALLPHPQSQAAQMGYEDRFGYLGLTTDTQRRAYAILEEQVANTAESFVVAAGENISIDDMRAAARALPLDRPDLFYFTEGNMKIIRFSDGSMTVNPRYILNNKATPELPDEAFFTLAGQTLQQSTTGASSMTQGVEEDPGITLQEIRTAKAAYEAKIRSILQSIPASAQTLQDKLKYLHDYLVLNITYQSSPNDQNAYSAIIEGKTVCAGYTKSYQDLLTRLGVKCWYVTGFATEAHAWNVLWLNGECVYTDVTWADQGTYILNRFYQISKEEMEQTHAMDLQYAAVLGSCNHNSHKHKMTLENVKNSVAQIEELNFTAPGQSASLSFSGADGSVSFHSSDPAVVTVTDAGEMTAVSEGMATITVILEAEGYAMQYMVTVGTAHQHSMEKVPAVEPTCTKTGSQEYWRCTGCGRSFLDQQGSSEIMNLEQIKLAEKEHAGGAWQYDATHHWKTCEGCGQLMAQSDGAHSDTDQNNQCDLCGYALPTAATNPTEPAVTEPPATQPAVTEPPVTQPPATESTQPTEATVPEGTTQTQPETTPSENPSESTEASVPPSTESGNDPTSGTTATEEPTPKDPEKEGSDTVWVVAATVIVLAAVIAVVRTTKRKR